jgi:hypothetical protein
MSAEADAIIAVGLVMQRKREHVTDGLCRERLQHRRQLTFRLHQGDQIWRKFSPYEGFFTLGFLNITKVANIFCLFPPKLRLHINIGKNGLGYTLGDIFTNSSGHPGLHHGERER